ncbi:hypothetical protein D3C76_1459950 [compost metagenome]
MGAPGSTLLVSPWWIPARMAASIRYGLASAPATRCSIRTFSLLSVGTRTATVRLSRPQLGALGT